MCALPLLYSGCVCSPQTHLSVCPHSLTWMSVFPTLLPYLPVCSFPQFNCVSMCTVVCVCAFPPLSLCCVSIPHALSLTCMLVSHTLSDVCVCAFPTLTLLSVISQGLSLPRVGYFPRLTMCICGWLHFHSLTLLCACVCILHTFTNVFLGDSPHSLPAVWVDNPYCLPATCAFIPHSHTWLFLSVPHSLSWPYVSIPHILILLLRVCIPHTLTL